MFAAGGIYFLPGLWHFIKAICESPLPWFRNRVMFLMEICTTTVISYSAVLTCIAKFWG